MKDEAGCLQPLCAEGEMRTGPLQLPDLLELRDAQILGREEKHFLDADPLAGANQFRQVLFPMLRGYVIA